MHHLITINWIQFVILCLSGIVTRAMEDGRCPPGFFRTRGTNLCYKLSEEQATWQDASHACLRQKAFLATPDVIDEDRQLRNQLQNHRLAKNERWIGGIYMNKRWNWAVTGQPIGSHSFSQMQPGANYEWHCIVMNPTLKHKWSPRNCFQKRHYICETTLQKK